MSSSPVIGKCYATVLVKKSPWPWPCLRKKIGDGQVIEDDEDALRKNHETWKPREIMGCGTPLFRDELKDGRLLVEMTATHKVRVKSYQQELPFMIAKAEVLETFIVQESLQSREDLIRMIKDYFKGTRISSLLELDSDLRNMSLPELIGDLFTLFRWGPEFKQDILEANTWKMRVSMLEGRLKLETANETKANDFGRIIHLDPKSRRKK